ncbi:hypothetical protein J7M23_01485, partial [Candidatus Sumerlaeota bacterium]|nr:hypothetical protein [Candidatus Sumerlaeota bacterium]
LDKNQKLILNRYKTKILEAEEFLQIADSILKHSPINEKESIIVEIIKARTDDPYTPLDFEKFGEDETKHLTPQEIESILSSYLEAETINFTRLRWFLRRLAQTGAPGGVDYIIDMIESLSPAIADVAIYLRAAKKYYKGSWKESGTKLVSALDKSIVKENEYLQIVILSLFSKISDLNNIDSLIRMYGKLSPIAQREVVLAAMEAKEVSWIREFKDKFSISDPWLRRAILFASKILPEDERRHWHKNIKRQANLLEKAIINV